MQQFTQPVASEEAMIIATSNDDIVPTEEFTAFATLVRNKARQEWKKDDATRLDAVFGLLLEVVHAKYQGKITVLVQRAKQAGENVKFSTAVADLLAQQEISRAVMSKRVSILKRALALLDFPAGFLDSLRMLPSLKRAHNKMLGKWGSHPEDHPVRQRLEAWTIIIRNDTRNQSELSVRALMSFFMNSCLPALKLDLEAWPDDVGTHVALVLAANPGALQEALGESGNLAVKATRLRFFLEKILEVDVKVPEPKRPKANVDSDDDDDGGDHHRISSEDLELVYAEAAKNSLDELLFMLMLTTGLRIAGAVKVLTRNVADVKAGQYVIRDQGKTKEKGNKFAFFPIAPRVKELLQIWLSLDRPADDGPFLFPGGRRGTHLSTDRIRSRFKGLCERAGLEGQEFHPHALRHTTAHMLLECGNSIEAVSKCLNHSSTTVTEKFYLRETAAETASRCILPWAREETTEEKRKRALDSLPGFLKTSQPSSTASSSRTREQPDAKKQRRAEKAAILSSFRPVVP